MQRFLFVIFCLMTAMLVSSKEKKQAPQIEYKQCSVNGVEFRLVLVEGGVFRMGGTAEQRSDALSTDKPVHKVLLDEYYIAETEVSRRLWKAVMGDTIAGGNDWNADDLPQEWVSWYDCLTFIQRLDSITGLNFRLPTEAEWEYAARGGRYSQNYRYSGSNDAEEAGWVYRNSGSRTHAVAAKKPNELGLYDMTGNVWEWCADNFGLYADTMQVNPQGAVEGEYKVVRGGSWDNAVANVNISVRQKRDPQYTFYDCGFRLALTKDKKPLTQVLTQEKRVKVHGHSLRFRLVTGDTIRPFYIAETEVTQAVWKSVMRTNPSHRKRSGNPVEDVSWTDCRLFISELNKLTSLHFRMPTSTEWLYAAQGGQYSILYERLDGKFDSVAAAMNRPKYVPAHKRRAAEKANTFLGLIVVPVPFTDYALSPQLPQHDDAILYDYKMQKQDTAAYVFSGSDNADDVAWHYGNSKSRTHRTHRKKANELGVYDMSGNVAEWTENQTVHGGSWFEYEDHCRVVDSKPMNPSIHTPYIGLRLVLEPE